jgi:hypothetical protein
VAILVLFEAACSLLVDTAGLSGASQSSHPAASSTGGTVTDGGGTVTDGGGGGTPDAGPLPCPPTALCEDFEGGGTLPWSPVVNGPATLVVDGVKPFRGAKSLHVRKNATGQTGQAVLRAPAALMRTCEFNLWFELTAGSGGIEIFDHYREPPAHATYNEYQALSMVFAPSKSVFGGGLKGPELYAGDPLPSLDSAFRRWVHVETHVVNALATVVLDGQANNRTLQHPPPQPPVSDMFLFGVNYETDTSNLWEVFVDDIVCLP